MKKIAFILMIACLSLTFNSFRTIAQSIDQTATASSTVLVSRPVESSEAKVKVLQLRLTEIKTMDKSTLTSVEKKNLRSEVRSIKQQLQESDGGLYISGGAFSCYYSFADNILVENLKNNQ